MGGTRELFQRERQVMVQSKLDLPTQRVMRRAAKGIHNIFYILSISMCAIC